MTPIGRAGRRARRRALALVPLSFAAALIGVGRARRGDSPHWFTAASAASAAAPPRMGRPFSSPARAQLWYEWRARGRGRRRRRGRKATAPAVLGAPVERDPERQTNYGSVFLALPIILAATWGPYAGPPGPAAPHRAASPVAATPPLSNATFVGVKFRAAGLAALGAWAVVIVCLALWWTYTGRPLELRPAWDRAVTRFGAARASVGCALAAVAAVLLTWRALAVGLCSGLTGRHWVVPAQIILGFFVFLQGMYE